ncbi:MAG: transcription factor S-II-related protein [Satyrvirus sp.]|uniref:Transcription factor S-II-related protein n=1 Tax=Satyrvirus sp. TaxID=2487771 RepID=A0A3G5AF57_9VIRU|nr:MAG: transcription factor S-II-related protein [Satyrvirus sp.]
MTTVIEFYIPDKDRKGTVKLLSQYFNKKHCQKIEKGYYDFTKQYCQSNSNNLVMAHGIYKDSVKNLLFNCEQKHNTIEKIRKMVSKEKYNPYNLAFLGPDELDKDNWMRIILRKNTTEEKLNNLPTVEWNACRVCKNKEYFYYQLQTRSADEPMTIYYTCKKCKKTYHINN